MSHSTIGPSAASRWMNCPGSVALCATLPKRSSSYADEGSAAHALAEKYFAPGGIIDLNKYIGLWLVQNQREWTLVKSKPQGGVVYEITQEMVDAITVYTDHIDSIESEHKYFEQKLDIGWVHPGIFGTMDCGILDGDMLHVCDYKHGAGVAVEVENNPQMMIYALGAIGKDARKSNVKTVRLTIIQPRKPHPDGLVRYWDIDTSDLMDWAENVLIPAAKATELENAPFVPGEKQCRWCEAGRQSKCPALLGTVQDVSGMSLVSPIVDAPRLPDPSSLTPADKARVLSLAGLLETWIENVRASALEEAQQGVQFPGLKLVHKITRRRWRDEAAVSAGLQPVLGDEIWETKLRSPSQIEKMLGKGGKEQLAPFTESPVGDLTLVPDTDRRRAVDPLKSLALLYDDI